MNKQRILNQNLEFDSISGNINQRKYPNRADVKWHGICSTSLVICEGTPLVIVRFPIQRTGGVVLWYFLDKMATLLSHNVIFVKFQQDTIIKSWAPGHGWPSLWYWQHQVNNPSISARQYIGIYQHVYIIHYSLHISSVSRLYLPHTTLISFNMHHQYSLHISFVRRLYLPHTTLISFNMHHNASWRKWEIPLCHCSWWLSYLHDRIINVNMYPD